MASSQINLHSLTIVVSPFFLVDFKISSRSSLKIKLLKFAISFSSYSLVIIWPTDYSAYSVIRISFNDRIADAYATFSERKK